MTSFTQAPVADGEDQTALLRHGDKGARRHQSLPWRVPADQGFHPCHLESREINLWLVVQHEFLLFESAVELSFEGQSGVDLFGDLAVKKPDAVSSYFLGSGKRTVSILQQSFSSLAILGKQAYADGGRE